VTFGVSRWRPVYHTTSEPALPSFLIKCHPSPVLTQLLVRRELAIGKENKKPKKKPKQNTSPSANVSQSLNSHHTPSSATNTLPIYFFHNKTSLRPESNTVRKNVNAAPASSTRSAQARGRSGQPQVYPTGPRPDVTRRNLP